MPKILLTESIEVELGAQEPWPQKIELYQPLEVEQILLPDNANCLAVQAYLKMCNLEFQIEPRVNAEFMSPSGRVPFIKCGAFIKAEFDDIVNFVNSKGGNLSQNLSQKDKDDMRAYICLVNNVLHNAEQYICWCDTKTLNAITKNRYGSVYPFPLNHFMTWQKKNQVVRNLKALGWYKKNLDEVFKEVETCCDVLNERLEKNDYFFGDKPTELDAIVYGHVKALTSPITYSVTKAILNYPLLLEHMFRIDQTYFARFSSALSFEVVKTDSESLDSLFEDIGSVDLHSQNSDASFNIYH